MPITNKLRILKIIDEYGWAFDFIANEQSRYSKHIIKKCRVFDLVGAQWIIDFQPDIVYLPTVEIRPDDELEYIAKQFKKIGSLVVGGYAGEIPRRYRICDSVVSISANFTSKLELMYPDKKVIFLPEGIDDKFFVPATNESAFKVGWAGRLWEVKRPHLLDMLDFPVAKQSKHNSAYFVENKDQSEMLSFYHSLSVFVLTSKSECMPRVVLEAMACGIPVISTRVGSLPLVLPSEWLVPIFEEVDVIREINSRLHLLKDNPRLRTEVGKINRNIIEKKFSWSVVQPLWDSYFSSLKT